MNRRSFFAKLVSAGAAAAVAAPVALAATEPARERGMKSRRSDFYRPLTLAAPVCPNCGDWMYFERRSAYPGEPVLVSCGRCHLACLCPTALPIGQWDPAELHAYTEEQAERVYTALQAARVEQLALQPKAPMFLTSELWDDRKW